MIYPNQNNYIKDNNETSNSGKSFLFDFSKGDFKLDDTGNLISVNDLEALKIWITKILKTDRNKFVVYEGTNYGIENLKELITSEFPFEFIKAEIENNVKEVLLQNKSIKSVVNFEFERDKRLLIVRFDCYTIYGTVKSEVII